VFVVVPGAVFGGVGGAQRGWVGGGVDLIGVQGGQRDVDDPAGHVGEDRGGGGDGLDQPGSGWRPRRTVLPGRGRWPSTPTVCTTVRAVLSAATAMRVAASAVSGTDNVTRTVTNRSPDSTAAVSSVCSTAMRRTRGSRQLAGGAVDPAGAPGSSPN